MNQFTDSWLHEPPVVEHIQTQVLTHQCINSASGAIWSLFGSRILGHRGPDLSRSQIKSVELRAHTNRLYDLTVGVLRVIN